MKNISFYMKQRYSIGIKSYPEKKFFAEIKEIPGLCAFGITEREALKELEIEKYALV
jgi:predicted RNase H-like HicB family nuclease